MVAFDRRTVTALHLPSLLNKSWGPLCTCGINICRKSYLLLEWTFLEFLVLFFWFHQINFLAGKGKNRKRFFAECPYVIKDLPKVTDKVLCLCSFVPFNVPNGCQIAIVVLVIPRFVTPQLSFFFIVEYYTKEKVQEGSKGNRELEKWANRIVGYLREKRAAERYDRKKCARHLGQSSAMNAILDADLSYIRNSEMQEEALVQQRGKSQKMHAKAARRRSFSIQ